MGCKFAAIPVTLAVNSQWNSLVPSGTDVEFYQSCDSTNIFATDAGKRGVVGPKWFIAGQQNAGRGRRGRPWSSPAGNLYSSYMMRPSLKVSELAHLPFLVSLAVRDTFVGLGCSSREVMCKWPNDVLISERKASGILIESSATGSLETDFIVIGIGLNLAYFPEDAQFPATSVAAELGHTPKVTAAFKILAYSLDRRLASWNTNNGSTIVEEWRNSAWGMGMRREIRTNSETFHATLIGLNDDGGLSLRLDNGSEKQLYAGDVFASPTNT